MSVSEHEVSREAIEHIVRNLRPRDRREIFALRWDDNEDQLIDEISNYAGAMWRVWSWDGEPVAVNGVLPVRPGVAMAGAFGTDKWKFTLRAMTRWSLDFVIPALRSANYHRGEAHVLASNTDSRRWIEALGGKVEALLQGFGRERENFLLYVWDLTEHRSSSDVSTRQRQCLWPEHRLRNSH